MEINISMRYELWYQNVLSLPKMLQVIENNCSKASNSMSKFVGVLLIYWSRIMIVLQNLRYMVRLANKR